MDARRLEALRESKNRISYDPETGIFTWLVTRCGKAVAGQRAGTVDPRGYRHIHIAGVGHVREHRLAYFFMTGSMPDSDVDHINQNKSDNRWANLRLAGAASNHANSKRAIYSRRKPNRQGKWAANIRHSGRREHIGVFDTFDEAKRAYVERHAEIHGKFSHHVSSGSATREPAD